MIRRLRLIAIALIALVLAPVSAQAFDIPLLTWERGREQQVVLGGGAYTQKWVVTLEGNGVEAKTFSASEKNDAGYVVYSLFIPSDLPTGAYSIVTNGEGSPRTVVAGINLIEEQSNTVTSSLFDLTLIIAIFIFLTGIVSTIRARKYTFIPLRSTQVLPRLTDPIFDEEPNFWDRLEAAPYRLRVQALISLRPSLLRFLLIREGEVAHRISKKIYGISPLVGLVAGAIAAIEVGRNEGLTSTPMTIFIAIAAIAIADAFAGVAATLGFWAIQLATGNVTSFRDFLIAIAVGIAWVGPSLFAALLRESINRDFVSQSKFGTDPIKVLGVIGSSLVGGTVFYFGHALINSVIYTENETRSLTGLHILIISVMLMVRGFADGVILERESELPTRDESFVISRVSSPITAFAVIALIFSFVYIWTAAASTAIFVAILFSLPYFLIFVRFNRISFLKTSRLPRNILLESALISGIAFIVFKQISMKPLLIDQRANLLLMLTAVAPIIHSIYSAIYSSNEDKFSFDENSETIRP
ncbi:MAG: hypothetical protein RIQ39_783 [Actinomycetota bacterium]|jgi:hypothetical protein